jgi:hypothetical protein
MINRMPLSSILEGIFGMLEMMFYTYRNERMVVPQDKINDITLGVSIARSQYRFFKQIISNKIKKWWKS